MIGFFCLGRFYRLKWYPMNRETLCCDRAFHFGENIAGGVSGSNVQALQRRPLGQARAFAPDGPIFGGSRRRTGGIDRESRSLCGVAMQTDRATHCRLRMLSHPRCGSCCLVGGPRTNRTVAAVRGSGRSRAGERGVCPRAPRLFTPHYAWSGPPRSFRRKNTRGDRPYGFATDQAVDRHHRPDVLTALAERCNLYGSQSGETRRWRGACAKKKRNMR